MAWNTTFGRLTVEYARRVWLLRDRRLDGLPLMGSDSVLSFAANAGLVLAACTLYLALAVLVGPALMSDRAPFRLRAALMAYNTAQVAANVAMMFAGIPAWIRTGYDPICQPLDHSDNADAATLARLSYYFFAIKFFDMLDTLFFVLRKNNRQLTFLHIYHHFLMPLFLWPSIRFVPGGNNLLPSFVNSCIHIFMYAYYFAAAMGIKHDVVRVWKRWMTRAQILQFVVLAAVSLAQLAVMESCDFPPEQTVANFCLTVPFLALFLNFYVREYVWKTNSTHRDGHCERATSNGHTILQKKNY